MGLLDNLTSAVNRGTASVERTANTARLKSQAKELTAQRRELAAQLGASLYETVKNDETLRQGREEIINGIADIDEKRAQIEKEIAAIEQQAQIAQAEAVAYTCPKCGSRVLGGHSFCAGCGLPIAQVIEGSTQSAAAPSVEGVTCASCGSPMAEDDLFCMSCGTKRELPSTEEEPAEERPSEKEAPKEESPVGED